MTAVLRSTGLAALLLLAACSSDLDPVRDSGSATSTSTVGNTSATNNLPSTDVDLVEVVDGDTIDVQIGGLVERVRLIGINAPERNECFADEATATLAALLEGRTIRLESDSSDRDQFDRLLRYVWVGDAFINEQLVLAGVAIARRYEPDTMLADRLEAAQSLAQEAGVGLWAPDACGTPVPDAEVRIVDIVYDAPGDDSQNLNGEWVVIQNNGSEPLDLTGWVLKDESSSHRYAFPSGFQLDPAVSVKVFSGCGADSETELFWCESGSAIWNNSGDTAFLLDPTGNTVATASY